MKTYTVHVLPERVLVSVTHGRGSYDLAARLPMTPHDSLPFSLEPVSPGIELLALALLWDASGSFLTAWIWHAEYARLFLGVDRGRRWQVTEEEIVDWVAAQCAAALGVLHGDTLARSFFGQGQ